MSVFICVNLFFLLFSSCSSKPTDLRTLVPAESLVYLESNDLSATLQPLIDAKPFREAAKSRPDFSALKGVQIAVAVTGFETSEEKLTDENSLARVQPRFAAVADTHSWNYAVVTFAEQKLGSFVADIYGGEPKLEKTDKHGGKYFTWTAADGRKAFGLVIDSLIYFGNDETAIEKCLAVRRGESDSILKTGKIQPASADILAAGYISPDGVAQIAGLLGIQLAAQSSDEPETQSAIAGIVPQLVRGTVSEASWTMKLGENGGEKTIEDSLLFTVPPDVGRVLNETIIASDAGETTIEDFIGFVPATAESVTFYNIKDPRLAWLSVISIAQKQTDPMSGRMIGEIAGLAGEAYGVDNLELFLESVTRFATVKSDDDSEDLLVIAAGNLNNIKNDTLKKAASDGIDFSAPRKSLPDGALWMSNDGDSAFASVAGVWLIGSSSSVQKSIDTRYSGRVPRSDYSRRIPAQSPVTTAGQDTTTVAKLIETLTPTGPPSTKISSLYVTETRFTRNGIERRTTSDFGLIGSIISFLDEE